MAVSANNSETRENLVAYWSVPLKDGVHTVEFDHGSTSGKRVLRVDGQEILRKEWMFKLVGDEKFSIGLENIPCELRVDPIPDLSFEYSLYVDGEPLEKFIKLQNKSQKSWGILLDRKRYTIVLEKETLNVWVNGENVETENNFTEMGTSMQLMLNDTQATIKTAYMKKNEGVVYELYINDNLILDES